MTVCELTSRAPESRPVPRRHWVREVALLGVLYAGYSVARMVTGADLPGALAHAHDLLDVETALHLDIEAPANSALEAVPVLAVAASYWYSLLHYLVTPAVLFWVYRARPLAYRQVRDALVLASGIGLLGFTLVPMAPPRMLPGLRGHPRDDVERRVVGQRRKCPARARRAHEPARGDAVAAVGWRSGSPGSWSG